MPLVSENIYLKKLSSLYLILMQFIIYSDKYVSAYLYIY